MHGLLTSRIYQANRCQMRRGNEQTLRDSNAGGVSCIVPDSPTYHRWYAYGIGWTRTPSKELGDLETNHLLASNKRPSVAYDLVAATISGTDAGAGAPEESKHDAYLAAIYSAKQLQIRTHSPLK
ncbi:hypothetical protein PG984_003880 [Apiospora sp. TS-2023a]